MKKNNKGFTLAELLIVVAIIAVLVAIAIPVFTTQLEKSREAADLANIRSAYGELITKYLSDKPTAAITATVPVTQRTANWQCDGGNTTTTVGTDLTIAGSTKGGIEVTAAITGNYTLTCAIDGTITCS